MSIDGRMGGQWQGATIPSATPVVITMNEAPLPSTITLKSADAGRKIELSTDGGVEYFTPAPTTTSATMQILVVTTSVSHVRITGAAAGTDTWGIR